MRNFPACAGLLLFCVMPLAVRGESKVDAAMMTGPNAMADRSAIVDSASNLVPVATNPSGRPAHPESEAAQTSSKKRWAISLAPLAASQALDAASSYGLRELNPVLAGSNGGFGMKATGIKFGAVAGLIGVEYLLVKKYPRSAKFFTVVNWTTAGATTGIAIHNYMLPGR